MTATALQADLEYLEVATNKRDIALEFIVIHTLWHCGKTNVHVSNITHSHEESTKLFQVLALTHIPIISDFHFQLTIFRSFSTPSDFRRLLIYTAALETDESAHKAPHCGAWENLLVAMHQLITNTSLSKL